MTTAPSRDDIQKAMREITPRLYAKLASLDDAYLAGPARLQAPGTKTVAAQASSARIRRSSRSW